MKQTIKGRVPTRAKNKLAVDLPHRTKQQNALHWASSTPKICDVFEGDLVTFAKDGKCSLTAKAVRSGNEKAYTDTFVVTVK